MIIFRYPSTFKHLSFVIHWTQFQCGCLCRDIQQSSQCLKYLHINLGINIK